MIKDAILNSFEPVTARYLTLVALLCAIELLIVAGIISFHVPFKSDPALLEIFFHYRKGFMPERELQLYAMGVMMAAGFFLSLLFCFRHRLKDKTFRKSMKRYAVVHAIFVIIEIVMVFRLIVSVNATAWIILYVLLGVSLLIKIFWSEINQCLGQIL